MTYHVAVWLDHAEAHVFNLSAEGADRVTVKAHGAGHLHHKAGATGDGRAATLEPYYHDVARAVAGAREIFVCGPGTAKTEFVKHLERHDKPVAAKIAKVVAMDHLTDGQVAAEARRFFKAFDRTTPLS